MHIFTQSLGGGRKPSGSPKEHGDNMQNSVQTATWVQDRTLELWSGHAFIQCRFLSKHWKLIQSSVHIESTAVMLMCEEFWKHEHSTDKCMWLIVKKKKANMKNKVKVRLKFSALFWVLSPFYKITSITIWGNTCTDCHCINAI